MPELTNPGPEYRATTIDEPVSRPSEDTTKKITQTTDTWQYTRIFPGGFFSIPRRKPTSKAIRTIDDLQTMLKRDPYAFMRLLPDLSPIFGEALWNILRFSIPADTDIRIEITKKGQIQDAETEEIENFFENLPDEIGGLTGLCNTLLQDGYMSDKIMVECVPAGELQGLSAIWPVCPDSIWLGRKTPNDSIQFFQYQNWPERNEQGTTTFTPRWVEVPSSRILWSANDSTSDDINGRIPYAPALVEAIRDAQTARDLSDAIRNAAYPTRVFKINFSELHKVAVEVFKKRSFVEAAKFVKDEFERMVAYAKTVTPSDNVVTDSTGGVENLQGGDFTKVEPGLKYVKDRFIGAVKSLPSFHGEGKTDKTSVEYNIFAKGASAKRGQVFKIVEKAIERHFRLQGKIVKAEIIAPKIRDNDELVEANVREINIRTGVQEVALGFIDESELCYRLNGKPPKGKPREGAIDTILGTKPDANGSKQTGNNNNMNQGGTQGSAKGGKT